MDLKEMRNDAWTSKDLVKIGTNTGLCNGRKGPPGALRAQNACRPIRYICNIRRYDHVSPSFRALSWLRLRDRRTAHSLSVEILFLPHRLFSISYTVPSTSNLFRILVIVILFGDGVPNATLQRR